MLVLLSVVLCSILLWFDFSCLVMMICVVCGVFMNVYVCWLMLK